MADDISEAVAENNLSRVKPAKVLPTTRIKFENQLAILRAYGAQRADTGENVTPNHVGQIVNLHPDTVRLLTPFFVDALLLTRQKSGEFVPHEAVVAFHRAYAWNAETAPKKLHPVLRDTWFGRSLARKLGFQIQMSEADAISLLADEAAATPDHRGSLALLIDYLDAAGVVEREGGQIRLPKPQSFNPEDLLPGGTPVLPATQEPKIDQLGPTMRTVKLPKSGGSITLSGNINIFTLTGEERELVFHLIDMMSEFEAKNGGGND